MNSNRKALKKNDICILNNNLQNGAANVILGQPVFLIKEMNIFMATCVYIDNTVKNEPYRPFVYKDIIIKKKKKFDIQTKIHVIHLHKIGEL